MQIEFSGDYSIMYQRYLRRHGLIQLVTCSINLRKHEHADRHEKYISVFCHFPTLRWRKLLKSFLMEYKDLILLHRQYHVDALLVRDQLTISYHFGSGNGLVPSADKPSSEPVFGRYRCHNTVSIVHNELILIQKMFLRDYHVTYQRYPRRHVSTLRAELISGNIKCILTFYVTSQHWGGANRRVNSSSPSPAYMRQWTGSALFQLMACRLFGAKPLPEPMLALCQLD